VKTLEEQIAEAFAVLGVLLVFVVAYFSAMLPQIDELLERPTPGERDARGALAGRLVAYRKLVAGFLGVIALVGVVVYPLTSQVLMSWQLRWPFRTLHAGLLLVDLFLIGMAVAGLRLIYRLSRRIRTLREALLVPRPARPS